MQPNPANPTPAPAPTVWTIKALLNWTTDFLAKKGIENPRADAQILLAHVLNCKRIDLIVRYGEEPDESQRTRFRELIQRRIGGWPVAYLVGSRDFYLLSFDVSPDVLIPRPETEMLVLEGLAFIQSRPSPTVLDLGSGSGCIAISIAHQKKEARLTAIDVSPDALNVARRNAAKHGVANRIDFLLGDLFSPLGAGTEFDLIVSNPPYIAQTEFDSLAADVRDHEPRVALDGGVDGLVFYRRIAREAARFLKPGGLLAMEIGYQQDEAVRRLVEESGTLELGGTRKDLGGHPRMVCARRK